MTDFQREVVTIKIKMLKNSRINVWSEEMDTAIIPVLDMFDERTKRTEIGAV